MKKIQKVIIIGGGIGGLTTALALKQMGIEVEVHEKSPHLQRHPTGFTLWSYAIQNLKSLGLNEALLDAFGARLECTEIRNQKGKLIESMPVGEVSRRLGAPSYEIIRPELLKKLSELLGREVVRMGSECIGVEQGDLSATALLNGGKKATGDLLIGADGIHSVVRRYVAGNTPLVYSGYSGVGAVIRFKHPLLGKNHHVEIWSKGAKASIGDVGNGWVRWYVTHKISTGGDANISKQEVLKHIQGWYGLIGAAVEATEEDFIVRNELWDLKPLTTWVRGRVVLLGDAAHATLPFAAMGANMAISDSLELSRLLKNSKSPEAATLAFQEHRKNKTDETVKKGRQMARLTQVHSPLMAWIRDYAFQHMPVEKTEEITRHMASGDEMPYTP